MILDPEAIANIRALGSGEGEDFLREIVDIFLTDTPARIREMDASLAAGDGATFSRAAHSIKGSSANLGAVALREAAEKAEQTARGGLAGAPEALEGVRAQFEKTREALKEFVPPV